MELCATLRSTQAGTLPSRRCYNLLRRRFLMSSPELFSSQKSLRISPGSTKCLRISASSEDTSTIVSPNFGSAPEEQKRTTNEVPYDDFLNETAAGADQSGPLDFLKNLDLDLKIGTQETYAILLYGAGALAVLRISSAILNTLDSIPLVPKVMEVVGLAYTIWFTYRYLIFKENREELFTRINDLKKQIAGSSDD